MIWIQTRALFVDAYRDLNARKMFWIVLILTGLVVLGFAALGMKGEHLTVLAWDLPMEFPNAPTALYFYKWLFTKFVVGIWLTWVATILALISTASIFPEVMAGGAIDLYVSKPIGRARLFLTKYVTGLLFVALQVSLFTAGSFFVLGIRGGVWEPGLFLAIPIVVTFFSYLFSICAFFGVRTRSTMAALFLTLLAWCGIWAVNYSETLFTEAAMGMAFQAEMAERNLPSVEFQIAAVESRVAQEQAALAQTQPKEADAIALAADQKNLQRLRARRDMLEGERNGKELPRGWQIARQVFLYLNAVIPKTRDTTDLLNSVLFKDEELQARLNQLASSDDTVGPDRRPPGPRRENEIRHDEGELLAMLKGKNAWWILGSSLGFEAVMVTLACWMFSRRDY